MESRLFFNSPKLGKMGENYKFDPICDDYPKIVLAQPFSRIFMVFHDIQSSVSYFVTVVKNL